MSSAVAAPPPAVPASPPCAVAAPAAAAASASAFAAAAFMPVAVEAAPPPARCFVAEYDLARTVSVGKVCWYSSPPSGPRGDASVTSACRCDHRCVLAARSALSTMHCISDAVQRVQRAVRGWALGAFGDTRKAALAGSVVCGGVGCVVGMWCVGVLCAVCCGRTENSHALVTCAVCCVLRAVLLLYCTGTRAATENGLSPPPIPPKQTSPKKSSIQSSAKQRTTKIRGMVACAVPFYKLGSTSKSTLLNHKHSGEEERC